MTSEDYEDYKEALKTYREADKADSKALKTTKDEEKYGQETKIKSNHCPFH